jgi:hypothetical protein
MRDGQSANIAATSAAAWAPAGTDAPALLKRGQEHHPSGSGRAERKFAN